MRISATLAAALCAIVLAVQPAGAAPLLTITLSPNPIEGAAGGPAVDVTYAIENVAGFDVTLTDVSASNIDGSTGEFDGLAGDWFDLPIANGATASGLLGQFRFFSTASVGTVGSAVFEIGFLAGPDGQPTSEDAALRYRVAGDTPSVPEPTSLVLLGFALAGAATTRRRA